MNRIITYLTFNGNCKEAMTFYQKCLGGELKFETIGENPGSEKLPQKIKEKVLTATLQKDNFILMATDIVGNEKLINGNSVSILIECESKNEIKNYFKKLAANGKQTYPIKRNYRGALFGGLTDKFNNNWLLFYI